MPWPIVWPLSPLETLWCAVALAGGYAVRGAAGFGSGVVAAPLLTFVLPLSTVAPVITILGLVVSTQQAVRDWLLIDWRRLGWEVEVSLRFTLDKTNPRAIDEFLAAAREVPEVLEIQTFLGQTDVRLNAIARDMAHWQEIYRARILTLPHIQDTEALMLISTLKDTEELPL